MARIGRVILVATCYGFAGALFGAAAGVAVGLVSGLLFGDIADSISFAIFFGAVVGGASLAIAGLLLDDGEGFPFLVRRNVMSKPTVLFLCTNNSARSQMAEALLKTKASDRFDAYSAGTEPKEIHPLTLRVMSEVGIDLSDQQPKHLRQFLGKLSVRFAIFVCQRAEQECPTLWPGALSRIEWPIEDPAADGGSDEERLNRFRAARDHIDQKITHWLTEVA